MKATEFCYWLQGAFELASIGMFDELQLACIQKHLELVRALAQDDQPRQAVDFCDWLRIGADFIKRGDAEQAKVVRDRLASVFEHAIDPGYANQDQLNTIHNGPNKLPLFPGMRC